MSHTICIAHYRHTLLRQAGKRREDSQTKGGLSNEGPPLKANGAATSGSRRLHLQIWQCHLKGMHAIFMLSTCYLHLQSHTRLPTFGNAIMPLTPHHASRASPTFTVQPFLDFSFFRWRFSLFLVCFSSLFSIWFFYSGRMAKFFRGQSALCDTRSAHYVVTWHTMYTAQYKCTLCDTRSAHYVVMWHTIYTAQYKWTVCDSRCHVCYVTLDMM